MKNWIWFYHDGRIKYYNINYFTKVFIAESERFGEKDLFFVYASMPNGDEINISNEPLSLEKANQSIINLFNSLEEDNEKD
jgi:hypothetical protein